MDSREFDGTQLKRVRENVWEIEAHGGMQVPARVFASEQLLEEIAGDKTLEQLQNTAHLPGIKGYAMCMPDGHQGYGFPVGGVAALDTEDGAISPGGVGFDINCLSGSTTVRLEHGRHRQIEDLIADFERHDAVVAADTETTAPIRLVTESDDRTVLEVRTDTGDTVEVTPDHRFETPDGLRPAETLDPGDTVYVHPFEGFEAEEPPESVLLDASDFDDEDPQLVAALEDRGLLPLRPSDDAFPYLLKLLGYHTGDGAFNGSVTWFYGNPTDLEVIQADIEAIGFTASRIYDRERTHEVRGNTFEATEYCVRSTSNAFQQLLRRLGAPDGPKVDSSFSVPDHLGLLPAWQRALYLSAFFGAEMSAPSAMTAKTHYCPSVSHNRRQDTRSAGRQFMTDLKGHLADLGIETSKLEVVEEDEDHDTVRFRFGVNDDSENLIRFFSRVGYRYNRTKRLAAAQAATYLKRKEHVIDRRATIAADAAALADNGVQAAAITAQFSAVNDRVIDRSIWNQRDGRPRPPVTFPDYDAFVESRPVRDNLTVPVKVESIDTLDEQPVYDIGVTHDDHTFLGNGFVVSNCGVRMMKTDLTYEDVRGHEEALVEALFDAIPSGLGAGGVVEDDIATVEEILARGVDWAREAGYATSGDIKHCEDEGSRPDARPEFVSQKAKDRGKTQIGSLGSGNHFLEVQRVTDIFREDVATDFGLATDQIVVLIHCGSRGLGHQICSDYVRKIEEDHESLVAQLPDKELAAAPAGSRLAEEYYGAMCAAINFAWVNRQLVMHQTREVFADVFDRPWEQMGMELLYDVAHNIAKKEHHTVPTPGAEPGSGEERELYVHRKGATRAFPPGHPAVPAAYRDVGQPIIIPGNMGSGSYVLRGGAESMRLTFGSTAHGAGRLMSRTQAKREFWGGDVQDALRDEEAIYVKAQSGATIAEEAPGVYKDVDEVVRVSDALGIGDRVARTFPVCNIKG